MALLRIKDSERTGCAACEFGSKDPCGQVEAHLQTLERFVIGVDVGGTKVAAGLVNCNGEIQGHVRVPMAASGSPDAGLAAVTSAIDLLLTPETAPSVLGIGICAPGPLDPNTGVVINPPNLPCWRNFPLADKVKGKYNLPVTLDNDANAAALAEAQWGAGRTYHCVFYATLGTGIGTGIVLDGRLYHGRTGAAGEGGHMSIDCRGPICKCGKPGCIEVLASGPAIAARARAKLLSAPDRRSLLRELSKGNLDAVSGEMVGSAYASGDPIAKEVLEETVGLLSLWLSNIVDLLDPEVIIIGGGVSSLLSPFFGEIRRRLPALCLNPRSHELPLVQACYKANAGIAVGAALSSHLFARDCED